MAQGAICKTEAWSMKSISWVDYNIWEVLWRFVLVSTGCKFRVLHVKQSFLQSKLSWVKLNGFRQYKNIRLFFSSSSYIWQHIHACFPSPYIGRAFSELEAECPMVLQADENDDGAFEAELKASSVWVQLGASATPHGKPRACPWALTSVTENLYLWMCSRYHWFVKLISLD